MATTNSSPHAPSYGDLLAGPAPSTCKSNIIDFSQTSLPEYAGHFAVLIDNLLTPEECVALLKAAGATTNDKWEQAMINIGGGRQMLATDTRNCGRIIWDDFTLAARLQNRILPHLPSDVVAISDKVGVTGWGPVRRKETWRLSRLNERLRFLKYTSGMYFRPHFDGSYVTPDGRETSFMTVHLYLNGELPDPTADRVLGSDDLPLIGGATRFFSARSEETYDVLPKMGSCLVFQHRNLVHSGEDVVQGTKYTLRTDIQYIRDKSAGTSEN